MLNSLHTLNSGTDAPSLNAKCGNPSVSDFNFMGHWKNLSLENIEGEIWLPMPNYETQYMVSNFGRVKGLPRIIVGYRGAKQSLKERIMSQGINNTGYYVTRRTFVFNGKQTNLVHRLVGETFLPNPFNLPEVNHVGENGDKQDNRVISLIWSTHADNIRHANDVLDVNGGIKHFRSKFTQQDVLDIFYSNLTNRELAKKYNVSSGTICSIKTKKSYKSILKGHHIDGKIFNSRINAKTILEIYNSKLPYYKTAEMWNVGAVFVYQVKAGIRYAEITGGIKNTNPAHNTKFMKDDIIFIRSCNLGATALSLKYNVSISTIKSIKNKKTYKWI
jgi:transposase